MEQRTIKLSSEMDVRRAKIDQLEKNGEIVYKAKFDCSCKISEAREKIGEKVRTDNIPTANINIIQKNFLIIIFIIISYFYCCNN